MNEQNNLPNMTVVKGLIAILLGLILIMMSYRVIVRMLFFLGGILLIYYGLQILNIPAINNALGATKQFFKKILP